MIFPKGYKWIYYFNHNIVFEGDGSKRSLAFKLNEAAVFIRSNSIVPIRNETWLVYLEEGVHTKRVIGGDYSDDIIVNYSHNQLEIAINRYYKS